jgi:hypothetical protein
MAGRHILFVGKPLSFPSTGPSALS